ncbi:MULTISPECIES: acyl-CoA desaturase [Arthrobacter]|uniref:Acyl-CoA desaturase n=2 Tax=Arthrobacter TaxID=1663 RepID=A0ABU9KFZ6_9MICC|nr:acyl-CoA desaturase [Arthrobacter sp. YJM1]MDP5225821.1 acyl-CoA desaturase [Arthrobacter sp. YJM1]
MNTDHIAVPVRNNPIVERFVTLQGQINGAGLLARHRGFYVTLFSLLLLAYGAAWAGFGLIGNSGFQVLIAVALGVLMTQFAFLAHEAAHRQIFTTWKANDWFARLVAICLAGISYAMWQQKHTRHHSNPNVIGKDPDIRPGFVVFYDEAAAARPRVLHFIAKRQGYVLFLLLPFLGISLQVDSYRHLLGKGRVDHRALELAILTVRICAVPALAFVFLPAPLAIAFTLIQQGVFGFYMGATFAPNHKGMKVFAAGDRVDFLTRQVRSSRNITGNWAMDFLMGGLNHQIEHHLFPTMPRPALRQAAAIVQRTCAEEDIPYTSTTLRASYRIVIKYLNAVGHGRGSVFDCPLANNLRQPQDPGRLTSSGKPRSP